MADSGGTKKKIEIPKVLGIILMISCIIAAIPLFPSYIGLNDSVHVPQNITNLMIIQLVVIGLIVILLIIAIVFYYKFKGLEIEWSIEK